MPSAAASPRHPDRPEEILEAACQAIVDRGFVNTRIADIAEAADTSTGTVHYHFGSKDSVLLSALRWATARLLDRLVPPPDAPALTRLARLLELSIPYPHPKARRDAYALWIEMWAVVIRDPTRLLELEDLSLRWRSLFFDVIERGARSGELRPIAEPPAAAERLIALVDGLGFETVVGYSWATPERMRATLLAFAAEQLRLDVSELDRQMQSEAW